MNNDKSFLIFREKKEEKIKQVYLPDINDLRFISSPNHNPSSNIKSQLNPDVLLMRPDLSKSFYLKNTSLSPLLSMRHKTPVKISNRELSPLQALSPYTAEHKRLKKAGKLRT